MDRLLAELRSAGLAVRHLNIPVRNSSRARATMSARMEKSIRHAMDELSTECGETGARIAILAESAAADATVLSARAEWRTRAFVLVSGRLSRQAKEILAAWEEAPTLCIVSSENRPALRDMTDVYFKSMHSDSDIHVLDGVDRGLELISAGATGPSQHERLECAITRWIRQQLSSAGSAREVSFVTEDGWKIFGNLLLPHGHEAKAPGVILLHSGRSDRYIFTGLERLLVKAGLAVLNIDWRGRGKSISKGRYLDLSKEERANGKLDASAAIDFLASQDSVDAERIGLVGVVHGAEHAVRGSIGDQRVRALALLTGYVPISEEERAYLTRGQVQVMYVTCTGHKQVTHAMKLLYDATPSRLARFLLYQGGAIGYQLFELDERLEPVIVDWLKECLR